MLAGFPHSEIRGSQFVCKLPAAYRMLQRPSSPLTAKASTVCAYSLDHITPISLALYESAFFIAFSAFENSFLFTFTLFVKLNLLLQASLLILGVRSLELVVSYPGFYASL
jgi:hypothetical protein